MENFSIFAEELKAAEAEFYAEERSEEYAEFLKKFEAKKTTDDCFTPPLVYDAVAGWVEREYGVDRSAFVRPFYPGGDYEAYPYPDGCIVVDNPPFSILAEITRVYSRAGIPFFLFAPTLTLFSAVDDCTNIPVGVTVTYDNGAEVNTSFRTNLEPGDIRVRTAPTLYAAVKAANDEQRKENTKEHPKYEYNDHIITAAMVAKWSKYGIDFRATKREALRVSELDAQRPEGKSIFGGGFILGTEKSKERAAAERASDKKWELSAREREIVRYIDEHS